MARKNKGLSDKQLKALELLTCGKGLTYTAIAEEIGVRRETLWRWLNEQQFATFQEEYKRLNDERWKTLVDAARASAMRLVEKDNQRMVEFVLKNEGYNPTQKVEADLHTDIVINIDEE
jgi:predicted DNA-binding protein (UPF0251 family)